MAAKPFKVEQDAGIVRGDGGRFQRADHVPGKATPTEVVQRATREGRPVQDIVEEVRDPGHSTELPPQPMLRINDTNTKPFKV